MYADAMMNLRPWQLWQPDGTPAPDTLELVKMLETVLRRYPDHPGANHYYVHAVEASPTPERALASATRLETLVPGAGHLVHMPTHIYIHTGHIGRVAELNTKAAAADERYIAGGKARGRLPVHVLRPQRALRRGRQHPHRPLRRRAEGRPADGGDGARRTWRQWRRWWSGRCRCRRWPTCASTSGTRFSRRHGRPTAMPLTRCLRQLRARARAADDGQGRRGESRGRGL